MRDHEISVLVKFEVAEWNPLWAMAMIQLPPGRKSMIAAAPCDQHAIPLVKVESLETSSPGKFEVVVLSCLQAMAIVQCRISPWMAAIPCNLQTPFHSWMKVESQNMSSGSKFEVAVPSYLQELYGNSAVQNSTQDGCCMVWPAYAISLMHIQDLTWVCLQSLKFLCKVSSQL